nr:immunoglobulin heavy chain junction region [Macaca mulatta]MOY22366.1 immunoglobulin heavy chain junction region [Macaca mulatta]MOY22662.1 immunoglobulin heavy chain junction region [Macaca mulatta]MOY24631.1 immunoglobulin heavy chain junction region [Macaca mulatta]MOY25992.1 immunoglobulin heavy chain junction region [Macaca mulatta]
CVGTPPDYGNVPMFEYFEFW